MNDMHRAVHIESGRIIEVSTHIAKQPKLMAEYGYMLQPLPADDLNSNIEKIVNDNIEIIEDDGLAKIIINETEISKQVESLVEKPKRSYNKQNK